MSEMKVVLFGGPSFHSRPWESRKISRWGDGEDYPMEVEIFRLQRWDDGFECWRSAGILRADVGLSQALLPGGYLQLGELETGVEWDLQGLMQEIHNCISKRPAVTAAGKLL
jgi:hypothetical protein